ncbi:MAG: APC family permease [Bifidobacterium mongoliense]|uniref:APC family permease n=1 Tax=Bifidobacterium mongoliense TaxID=518643 RepID=UPI0026482B77|nr:APC family permease [Bifidobacterium mongoliense]MDN6783145.1 APC family permease [Bifidobacterium mongoliense]
MKPQRSLITVSQMSIMTIITIAGLRGLPAMAVMGWQSIILYLLPAVVFFVPSALVSAELGATYEGGIYQWVKEGLGKRFGFLAIWMQWIHNVVWYPAQLAFVAAAAASAVGLNRLTDSGVYITTVIIVVFWWAVWLALKGGNLFAKVASAAGLVGTIIPACLLLILGAAWLLTGQHISTTLTHSSPLPTFTNFASFALIVQNVLAFAGMEVNAVHAQQMDHPKRYTRVVGIAFVSALAIFIVPTLILAMVLPRNVNLSDGTVIAFQTMFNTFHIGFMGNVVAFAIVFGAIASIISWISGPSLGLLEAAKDGCLPDYFKKTNANGAQSGILMIMGVLVTLLAMLYIIFPKSVSMVFSLLIGMAVALYVMMYILMFVAAINLRRQHKTGNSGYRAPALYVMAGVGIVACVCAFVMTFVPAAGQTGIPTSLYPVITGLVVAALAIPSVALFHIAHGK